MKVYAKRLLKYKGKSYKAGDPIELDKSQANRYIDARLVLTEKEFEKQKEEQKAKKKKNPKKGK